ncbi:MAG: hypothetical protein IPJ23_10975 [Ignavibacteriales bacterium]|nr:hypothetical protein [Ignavibacteriales bacterium]
MANEELISDVDRFIILDILNTLSETEFVRTCPCVQIVDSLNEMSYQDIDAIKSRVGNDLKLEEKRNHLFTITINVETDYKTRLFR